MVKNKINKDHLKDISSSEERSRTALWMRHGIEDVYFQRDAQVNFWTILGGIAVAALLTQMSSIIEKIQMGHWYLLFYLLISITLIVNSWVQNLWGGLILRMQVTMLHTLLVLIDLICLAIICLQVTNPLVFFVACGFFVLFSLFIQVYLMKSEAWVVFTSERIKKIKVVLRVNLVFMILCFVAVAHLFFYPSVAAEIGWGIFALLASISAMVMQHYGMKQERKELGVP
jgi:hypothetical protein